MYIVVHEVSRFNQLEIDFVVNSFTDQVISSSLDGNVATRGDALDFWIAYTIFSVTGRPGSIGFAGQQDIGKNEAKLAMKMSQNTK